MDSERHQGRTRLGWFGLAGGPVLFLIVLLLPAGAMGTAGKSVLATVSWMAVWWVTEAVPIAATSLLPLVLFPLLDVRGVKDVGRQYGHHMVFLFLGGFVLALAVERSGLHRRFALRILRALGDSRRKVLWGFLIATALLSMWLSNTATTLMMLPIAAAVVSKLDDDVAAERIFLAVAYGASIGGLGTLIGTPPNLVLAGMAHKLVPGAQPITFGGWMAFGIPMVALLLPIAGVLLSRGLASGGNEAVGEVIEQEYEKLGGMSAVEKRAALLFGLTVLAWVTRSGLHAGAVHLPGWSHLLPHPKYVSDAVPAILAAVTATVVPSGRRDGSTLLSWEEISRGVPWGVLLLFGGGFAIADAVHASKLDHWLGNALGFLGGLPVAGAVLAIAVIATTATELTSNTAMATLLIPVMAALAPKLNVSPYLLMTTAAVACSYAFMLPVATPPNAIVMGSGHVSIRAMARRGLELNIVSALLLTALMMTLGKWVLAG